MTPIRHYYHCFAGGAWSAPVRDHFTALGRAGLDDLEIIVGMVGPNQDCDVAQDRIRDLCRKWTLPEPRFPAREERGWEQVTLQLIHDDMQAADDECHVLYMHTKGAYNNADVSATWRRAMTAQLVGNWEGCVRHLEGGKDAVGCHWMKAPEWPDQVPFFAGNFWWATSSFLRKLEPPENETRWTAEVWVPLGHPDVHDMIPGAPHYNDV